MPMKLNVGLSRKVGEPNYGVQGANVNVELDNSLGSLANRILAAFLATPDATPDATPGDTVIGIDEELLVELISGVPDLLARIDLLMTTSDTLVITDFKTARSRWSQGQAENSSAQLFLYSELARRLMPDREVRLRFLVLTKTKNPTVESFEVNVSQHRVHRTTKAVERNWGAIEAGDFYPAPSPMNCPTCPSRSECNAWTGNCPHTRIQPNMGDATCLQHETS